MKSQAVLEAFADYACAQAALGFHLLAKHRRDDSETCLECGQPYPCSQRRRGAELILHFGHWNSPRLFTGRGYIRRRRVMARRGAARPEPAVAADLRV